MDSLAMAAEVLRLTEDSPVTAEQVLDHVRESVAAGEVELAFETLCSWIYEDELPITREYHERLLRAAEFLATEDSRMVIGKLHELVVS